MENQTYIEKGLIFRHALSPLYIASLLLSTDILGLIFSYELTCLLSLEKFIDWSRPGLYCLLLLSLAGLYLADVYRLDIKTDGLSLPARVVLSNLTVGGVASAIIYLSKLCRYEIILDGRVLLPSLALFTVWCGALRLLVAKWVELDIKKSNWLVLAGTGNVVDVGCAYSLMHPEAKLVFLAENPEVSHLLGARQLSCSGSLNDLYSWTSKSWSGVLVETKAKMPEPLIKNLMQMRLQGLLIYNLPDFCEKFWSKIPPSYIQDDWFTFTSGFKLLHNRSHCKIKRLFDLAVTGLLLIILLPFMPLVALAIKLDSPGPIFYSQTRTGRNRQLFKVYKFRSMYQNAEAQGALWASQSDSRITTVGRWLRLTRIDELPQLWNVLRGEMSLIGPRPERPEFDAKLAEAIPYYNTRYLVTPGISGWAQVMYPYGASVEDAYEKLSYDLYYIKNYSLFLDLAIALKTIKVVLWGKGR